MHPGAEWHRYSGPATKIPAVKDRQVDIIPGVKTGGGEAGNVS